MTSWRRSFLCRNRQIYIPLFAEKFACIQEKPASFLRARMLECRHPRHASLQASLASCFHLFLRSFVVLRNRVSHYCNTYNRCIRGTLYNGKRQRPRRTLLSRRERRCSSRKELKRKQTRKTPDSTFTKEPHPNPAAPPSSERTSTLHRITVVISFARIRIPAFWYRDVFSRALFCEM